MEDETAHHRIQSLFAVLEQQQHAFALEKALHTCDQILALAPGDADAFRCKIAVTIHAEQYESALRLLESSAASSDFQFEKAYCLYRLERHAQAIAQLEACEASAGVAQLRAQLLYRLNDGQGAVSAYEAAYKAGLLESQDARTNFLAAYTSANRAAEVAALSATLGVSPGDSYVAAYNTACSDIAMGRLADARRHLSLAQRMGRETLMDEDDLSEAELQAELLPIYVQQAHVAFLQGRAREAAESYARLLKLPTSDAATAAVAANNLVAIRQSHEVFDSLKRLDRLMCRGGLDLGPALITRMSTEQRNIIRGNRAILLLLANRVDQCCAIVDAMGSADKHTINCALIQAACCVREKKPAQADQLLEALALSSDARVLLMRAQLAAGSLGDAGRAIELLRRLPDALLYSPRVVATLAAMTESQGDSEQQDALLDEALRFWAQHPDREAASLRSSAIVFASARFKYAQGQYAASAELLTRLVQGPADDGVRRRASQALIRSLAVTDINGAEQNAQALAASVLALASDAEELDSSPQLGQAAPVFDVDARKRTADAQGGAQQQKRRKRKPRYPAGFDPAAQNNPPPDPERWLPKRERAAFKAKGKKAKAAALRGSQGAVASAQGATAAAQEEVKPAAPSKVKKKGRK